MNIAFEISETRNCPLYEQGDRFALSEKSFSGPVGKEACLILVRDLTQFLFRIGAMNQDELAVSTFNCSGCVGLIKYRVCTEEEQVEKGAQVSIEDAVQEEYGIAVKSPFLRALPAAKREETLAHFGLIEISTGTPLILKDFKNMNIYLLLEGTLVVENDGFILSRLGKGDICGEMSYLGADLAVSTVRALSDCRLLAISGAEFGELFGTIPDVQLFMARLMAQRLNRNNIERARDFASCMTGRIDKTPPAELLQIFHMNQKTGVLRLELVKGIGQISFREGAMISALYGAKSGKDAVFAILAAKKGLYRFSTGILDKEKDLEEIGEFMTILMEGVQRLDENS